MSYTLLNGEYKEYNIFRIIDEINAVIKKLKEFLISQGYDGNKLELILFGGSAGAHLCLLYSYMIKNPPIPIRFIINNVGPVTLIPDYYLTTKPGEDPLENIEPKDIDKAKKDYQLIFMNGNETGVNTDNITLMSFMNDWLGLPSNDSFDQIFSDLSMKEINKTNEIYQERINKTSYAYPINYVTEKSIPTLCLYGGKDEEIGVAHYSELKKAFERNNNTNITLIYFRYGTHDVTTDGTEYGKNAIEKYNQVFTEYCHNYLYSYKYNN